MMKNKRTLVLGASNKPERYSYLAINRLRANEVPTLAVGKREYTIGDVEVMNHWDHEKISDIHTVTLYLSAKNQDGFIQKILDLKPNRVIFNPGTENPDFESDLSHAGIKPLRACTLVLLATGQY